MIRLTVVLPTYNRGRKLLLTLDSLLDQTLDRRLWEVVVVNNNSTDDTATLLETFVREHAEGNNALQIRTVLETNQGLSHARNRGIDEAKGDIFVFIDDDELINPEFLQEYLDLFETHPDASIAGGPYVAHFEYERPVWVTKYTEMIIAGVMSYGDRVRPMVGNERPNGGNMAIRRRGVDKYGKYDVTLGRTGESLLGGEERELVNRFRSGGEAVYYQPNSIIYHCIPQSRWTFDYLRRVSYMVGVSERRRTKNMGGLAFVKRCFSELYKWGGVAVLFAIYTVKLTPIKGWSLVVMRYYISKGLCGR